MLKTQAAPSAVLLIEVVLALYTSLPEWLIGLLIGATTFWLVFSLLFDTTMVKRFPRLREWLPFLDPSGGFASHAELSSRHIQGKTFRLIDVARDGYIINRTFDECVIHGPAVIAGQGSTVMRDPNYLSTMGHVIYEFADQQMRAGMIAVKDCTFNRCVFHNIGLVGKMEHFSKNIETHKLQDGESLPDIRPQSGD